MFNFFAVHGLEETEKGYDTFGVAFSPDFIDAGILPPNGIRFNDWKVFEFELRDGTYSDYQASDLSLRLCSEKLRNIIDDTRTQQDEVQWFETIVKSSNGEKRTYYALHFPMNYPVIDYERSHISDHGIIIKPIFLETAFDDKHICVVPNEYGISWYISNELLNRITKAKCTGISFTKVTVRD